MLIRLVVLLQYKKDNYSLSQKIVSLRELELQDNLIMTL